MDRITTPDGLELEVLVRGPEDGFPLVYHGGTPSAAVPFALLDAEIERHDLRMVTYSRPGYGASAPRSEPHRPWRIADDVHDTAAVVEGPENVRDFNAAAAGRDTLAPFIDAEIEEFAEVTAADVTAAFGELVDEVDAAALTGDVADYLATSFRHAALQGSGGFLEDNLVIVRPWGFDVASIKVPVSVWQGAHDRMVPFAHGQWLAGQIPGARAHLFDDEGHLSLVHHLGELLAELRELAGLPPAA